MMGYSLVPRVATELRCELCGRFLNAEQRNNDIISAALFGRVAYAVCPACQRQATDPDDPVWRRRVRKWIRLNEGRGLMADRKKALPAEVLGRAFHISVVQGGSHQEGSGPSVPMYAVLLKLRATVKEAEKDYAVYEHADPGAALMQALGVREKTGLPITITDGVIDSLQEAQ